MTNRVFGSLARISDLEEDPFELETIDQASWATGDYVECEVVGAPTELYTVEDCLGETVPVAAGDRIIGALGHREATLEGVGSWQDVRDGHMHMLTGAGLLGWFTSFSKFLPGPLCVDYRGHVSRSGIRLRMADFAIDSEPAEFSVPTLLIVGTSMSAGKTIAGRLACRVLSQAGLDVIGSKLTGAGRYRDIRSFKASGASEVFDFVDAGLPSTIVPESEFRRAIRPLLSHVQGLNPDVLLAEAGASPLEPYNGAAAIDELGDSVRYTILSASDPYAVVGVQKAFGLDPDLVTGPAANTSAAVALVTKLTGIPAIDVYDPESEHAFADFVQGKFAASH